LAWIFTNAPNLGKPGYASTIDDLLPGSAALPQKVIIPEPKETKPEKYAWEED
jgi:transposase